MKIMVLIIGRDDSTKKLYISAGNNTIIVNEVPKSVSQKHIKIEVTDKNEIFLTNLSMENVTFVNGLCVEYKRIVRNDRIELGYERYRLSWEKVLTPILPKFADIRHLEKVWNAYKAELLKLDINQGRLNSLRNIMMLISPISAIIGGCFYSQGMEFNMSVITSVLIAVICLFFLVLSWTQASSIPLQRVALEKHAQEQYKCPICGQMLPLQKYEMLKIYYRTCPNPECNARFIS